MRWLELQIWRTGSNVRGQSKAPTRRSERGFDWMFGVSPLSSTGHYSTSCDHSGLHPQYLVVPKSPHSSEIQPGSEPEREIGLTMPPAPRQRFWPNVDITQRAPEGYPQLTHNRWRVSFIQQIARLRQLLATGGCGLYQSVRKSYANG